VTEGDIVQLNDNRISEVKFVPKPQKKISNKINVEFDEIINADKKYIPDTGLTTTGSASICSSTKMNFNVV
jgi:hypothetical protein